MVHVTSFCGCMGLEVGAKIIGFLHLLVSLGATVVSAMFAQSAGAMSGTVEDADGLYSTVRAASIAVACISVGHGFLALTLIYSVSKRWASGVRAWVWVMLVLLAAALLTAVGSGAAHGLRGSGSDIFLAFLEGLLFFGGVSYCILCVHSYYLLLKSSEDMGPKDDY